MQNKLKVAVIGLKGLPAFGGAATVGENIIEQLKDEFEFTVYSVSSHTNLKTGKYNDYKQIVFKSFFKGGTNTLIYYFKSAFHCLFLSNYDLIHLHHIDGSLILPLLKIKYKVVATAHGRPQDTDKWNNFIKYYFRMNEKIFLTFPTIITVVGKPLFNVFRNYRTNKIKFIPNGVIKDSINYHVNEKQDIITFAAGRIISSKGCHTFLKALKILEIKSKIFIIGDLDQIESYKIEIKQLSKGLNVSFLGLIKNKQELLSLIATSKFFVFPTEIETMSMMLLEVVSKNVPVIASNIPENTSIFNSNEVLFFDNKNVNDLAEKIKFAINNSQKMESMASLALNRLKNEYTWEKIAPQYAILYDELI